MITCGLRIMTDLVLLFTNDAVDIIMGMYALHTWKKSLLRILKECTERGFNIFSVPCIFN